MTSLVVPVFLLFFAAKLSVETVLGLLNQRHARRATEAVPPSLAGAVDPETARRSRAYALARGRFALVEGVYDAALTLALLFSGLLPALERALGRAEVAGANRAVLFLLALAALAGVAGLPFSLFGTFVLEERFGFNRTTVRLWLKDRLKGLALAVALGVPLLYAAYGFFALAGSAWWLWLFVLLTAVQLALLWLYPALIAPLFNRFTPLSPGELKTRLEALAEDAGFRTRGLYVMDASRRSGHSNAYFAGFVRPRIVLFDTLIAEMSVEEAAAVLAHEIGHYRARHVHKRLLVALALQLLSLWVLARLAAWPPLFAAFGLGAPSFEATVALASLCGGAFTFFLAPLESRVSRRHEYEADRYSVRLARAPTALKSALVKLNRQNLANLNPHPWYSAWHYSHPALAERLLAIDRTVASEGARSGAG
ncbi:MAG TPA: M48 family metallopeptidase [Anaeromyxobacteraceae bacterium]|nr:M48 family metallopeptidase [Anaeromyxobacteraceae bacterium]